MGELLGKLTQLGRQRGPDRSHVVGRIDVLDVAVAIGCRVRQRTCEASSARHRINVFWGGNPQPACVDRPSL
jgi:hypothetical protein